LSQRLVLGVVHRQQLLRLGLGQQLDSQPPPSSILRINESPVLPQLRPDAVSPTGVPRPLGDTAPPPPPTMAPSLPASGPVPTAPAGSASEPEKTN